MSPTTLDSVWVTVCAFLVFFMHAGFALVESGFCRKKNAVMVLLKNVAVVSIASLVFYAFGFGLMFGDGNGFIGLSAFFPETTASPAAAPEGLPLYVFLFFQLVFAATAATIVSGAVAERARLGTFFAFTAVASGVVYPIAGHWVWGGGWLADIGFHDFAGSTVVHAVGGAMALVGAIAIGPRLGKYTKRGVRPLPAHSFPLAALGVFVLWLGWFGFNGGSTLAASPAAVGSVIVVTNLAAAAGFLAALAHVRWRTGMLDLSMGLNGVLSGLVAITAGCDVIGPGPAMIVGAVAGVVVVEAVLALDRFKIDDPVGAVPVHLVGGLFGTAAVGIFGHADGYAGLVYGGGFAPLGTQLLGAGAAIAFAGFCAAVAWYGMRALPGGIRVSEEHEAEGLDLAECGVEAYADEVFGTSQARAAEDATEVPASDRGGVPLTAPEPSPSR